MTHLSISAAVCAAIYLIAGVAHFAYPKPFFRMMPPWIPAHAFCVYGSGVAEIGLGVGLLFDVTRPWAAWGVIALLVAVFPANLYMFQAPERFKGVPRWVLAARLPLQAALIWWAWSLTVPTPSAT